MAEQRAPRRNKLFSSAESVLVRKDLSAIWSRKGIRALLMVVPVVLLVLLPLVYFVAINLMPTAGTGSLPKVVLELMPEGKTEYGYRQCWMNAFTTLLCPMLFLSVPIICGTVSASCVFVSEKENGTLETLFLSSMSVKSIFNAKITVCVLLSVIISLISFVIFAITASIANLLLSAPYFFNLEWLITVLILMPALALFSVVFVSLVLPRVYSTGESLQTMGYLMLPVIVLHLVQFTGAFRIGTLFLIVSAVLLLVFSIVLFNVSSRQFHAENLLPRAAQE